MKLGISLIQISLRGAMNGFYKPACGLDDVQILYQSANYIVVNKHFDIKINSDDPLDDVTVSKQLAKKFPDLIEEGLPHYFRFCHRLDYSTSGALCIALNKKASSAAQKMFMTRAVQKEYLAIVRGHMPEDHVVVDRGIYPNQEEGLTHMMCVAGEGVHDNASLKSAKTDIEVLQRGLYDGDPATKIRLLPFTGRRHQLRVHCLSLGHPIVGDYTYSNRKDIKPYRMMLHSHKLYIPSSIEEISVTAPDPFVTDVDPKWDVNR